VLPGGGGGAVLLHRPGTRASDLLKRYAKSHGLHVFDSLVAATAIEEGLTLVTRNRRHFAMIEGLSLLAPQY